VAREQARARALRDAVGHEFGFEKTAYRFRIIDRNLRGLDADVAPLTRGARVVDASERRVVRSGRERGARAQECLQGASWIALLPPFELAGGYGVEPQQEWSGR